MASLKPIVGYSHVQENPATAWNVAHGLNCYPTVDVYVYLDGVLNKIIPKDVLIVDENTLQIVFSDPQSGKARII